MKTRPDLKMATMLTTTMAGRLLGVHPNTIVRWANQGILPCFRIGPRNDRRFVRDELIKYLHSQKAAIQ